MAPIALAVLLLLGLGVDSASFVHADGTDPPAVPASGERAVPIVHVVDDGSAVTRVIAARRFTLTEGYRSSYGVAKEEVRAGWIVALAVAPRWLRPRSTRAPVLYLGESDGPVRLAERFHPGWQDGVLVVVVPDGEGADPLDLAATHCFFGTPMLPERVTRDRAAEELRAARANGVRPLPAEQRPEVVDPPLSLADRAALHAVIATWIDRHAPADHEAAATFRPPEPSSDR